jgi:hypothetical protein
VVLADFLKPERRDADRALADLAIPREEAGGERLAIDLGLAGGIDEKAGHVLPPSIEAGRAVHARLRRLEIGGELADHVDQIEIPESRVGDSMNRTDRRAGGQKLYRLLAARHRFAEHTCCRLGSETAHGVLVDAGQVTQLIEAPIVQFERAVAAGGEDELIILHCRTQMMRRMIADCDVNEPGLTFEVAGSVAPIYREAVAAWITTDVVCQNGRWSISLISARKLA